MKGIFFNIVECKLSQCAEHTEYLLAGDRKLFQSSITSTVHLERKSGLYMNTGKTSVVWLGSERISVVKYMQDLRIELNPPKFKVLGI